MKKQTNTTLNRKPSFEHGKAEGLYKPKTARNQSGDDSSFAFNGQMGDGVNRSSTTHRFAGSPTSHLAKNPDSINHGLIEKNRKGNASDCHTDRMEKIGPSATKDGNRYTVATASQGHPVEPGYNKVPHVSNPDSIYITKAER